MTAARTIGGPLRWMRRDARGRPASDDGRRVLITPEGLALPMVLASRGTRLGALLIDVMLMFICFLVISAVLAFSAVGLAGGTNAKAAPETVGALQFLVIIWIAVMFLTRYGYFLLFELGPRGATPGKRMAGIRIAARDGGRLSAEMVLARNLLRDIELFLPLQLLIASRGDEGTDFAAMAAGAWFLIFALFPFFNRDRLRAGDLIAGTWVVEAPKMKLEAVLTVSDPAANNARYQFGEAELAIYGEYEVKTLEGVLRDNQSEAIVAVHRAICRKIGWEPGAGDERAFLEAYYTQLRARLESGMRFGKRKADKHSTGGG